MYCSTCGTLINTGLNFCNRCGAKVDKIATVDNSSSAAYLSMATGFVSLGGLGLTVGLIAILLKYGVVPEAIVILALAFLGTVLSISFMMVRQMSQMNRAIQISNEKIAQVPQLDAPTTAQLAEPRQPARSVTENTTRTLEKELIK